MTGLCSTLKSWVHKISTRIKFCPLDWRTTIHWNVVLAIFQHYNICQDCWKKYQINIWMYHYSQIQGTRSKKDGKQQDKSVPYFQQESGPCPLDERITIHSNVHLVFFQQSWHIFKCWKIARPTFQCMVVLQSRRKKKFLVKINEARISAWNLSKKISTVQLYRFTSSFSNIVVLIQEKTNKAFPTLPPLARSGWGSDHLVWSHHHI